MQLTSASHRSSLVTHDSASALWRLVRKGIAPAFATNNIKWAPPGVMFFIEVVLRHLVCMFARKVTVLCLPGRSSHSLWRLANR